MWPFNSQKKLAGVAKNDKDVRRIAVEKLTDQKVLADFDKNAKDRQVRYAAVEKITKQKVLADIAKNDKDSAGVRMTAVEKLIDQNLLADIVKNAKDRQVRHAAVEKITEQDVLADIAKNDKDSAGVRMTAVEKLTDQNLLADIAKNAKDRQVRHAAVEKITEQDVLADIAKNDKDSAGVRMTALEKLTVQNLLADIAKNYEDGYVREAAVKKLLDDFIIRNKFEWDQQAWLGLLTELKEKGFNQIDEKKIGAVLESRRVVLRKKHTTDFNDSLDSMSYDQLVEELVRLSREGYSWALANGFVVVEKYPQYSDIKRIGQLIFSIAGYSGMQMACSILRQRVIVREGGGQYLAEHSWTGISDWRS